MHIDQCDAAEPPLGQVDGDWHFAACIRSGELVANEVTPAEIFTADASDSELAAATSLGERANVEPAAVDGGEQA
jgi:hypothetical protein